MDVRRTIIAISAEVEYEQWASKEALDAHGKTPHMKALGGKLKDKTEKGVVVFYELLK